MQPEFTEGIIRASVSPLLQPLTKMSHMNCPFSADIKFGEPSTPTLGHHSALWFTRRAACTWPLILVLLIACSTLGCKPKSRSADSSTADIPAAESAEVPQKSAGTDFTALIEAGVTLIRSSNGDLQEALAFDTEITDELAKAIGNIDTLKKLTLRKSAMTTAGWQSLGSLTALEQLDLRDCPLGNAELSTMVSNLAKLRALRLSGKDGATTVDDDGLAALAACPELKALMLDHLWVGQAGIEHLSKNQKLAELYLAGTLVDDLAMEAIANIPSIVKLRLAQTTVSATGLQAIGELKLQELDISECSQVFDDAMEHVGKFTELTRLNLWRDAVTDEGVAQLAPLTKLRWLNLDNTQLTDAGLPHLHEMSQLEFLHLGSTGVTDMGMPGLTALKSLKELIVTRTAVTEAGVSAVTSVLPAVKVQIKYLGDG